MSEVSNPPKPVPLSEHAPVALLSISPEGKVKDTNPASEVLFGRSRRGLVGQGLDDLLVVSDELQRLVELARRTEADAASPLVVLKPAGLAEARRVTVRVRWFESGDVVLALSRIMEHEQEDPVAGVASFGRILGHEIKNPLAGISGAAQLLERRARKDDRELLQLIGDECARIERLVNRLSAFELFSSPRLASMNIHALLDRIIAAEEAAFDGKVIIRRHYDPSLPEIDGDEDHLHEAIQNIIRNAIEAGLANQEAEIARVDIQTRFESRFARRDGQEGGALRRALRIDIEDNGGGIDQTRLGRVFDAFSSSKSAGRGLGLTVVKEVITAHNGQVQLANTGDGTRVSVFLPMAQRS